MTKVKNLPCPACSGPLTTDGRAWVECACGYRHGAFVRSNGDGTFSVKLRSGGRPPSGRVKNLVHGRMYDDDKAAIEARGYTVQSLLDEAVARVVAGGPTCKACGEVMAHYCVNPACKDFGSKS